MRLFEIQVIQTLQKMEFLAPSMRFISDHGFHFCPVLVLISMIFVNRRAGLTLGFMYVLSQYFTLILKLLFHQPRPFWISESVQQLGHASGYAFPSGHTFITSSILFGFAFQFSSKWIRTVSVMLAVLMGFTRVYLGVHWPSDVLSGLAFAAILVWCISRLDKLMNEFTNKTSIETLAMFGILGCLILGLTGWAIISWSRTGAAWSQWQDEVKGYPSFYFLAEYIGMLVALVLGSRLFARLKDVRKGVLFQWSSIGYIMVGFILLKEAFGMLPHIQNELLHLGRAMTQSAMMVMWSLFLAPYLMQLLSKPSESNNQIAWVR